MNNNAQLRFDRQYGKFECLIYGRKKPNSKDYF